MKPETPNASHANPHFWREIQMETHQARQVDLSRLRRSRSAASQPKRLAPLAKRSTCSKSKQMFEATGIEYCEILGFVRIFWKNNIQEAYFPKTSLVGQIVSVIMAQLCSDD